MWKDMTTILEQAHDIHTHSRPGTEDEERYVKTKNEQGKISGNSEYYRF